MMLGWRAKPMPMPMPRRNWFDMEGQKVRQMGGKADGERWQKTTRTRGGKGAAYSERQNGDGVGGSTSGIGICNGGRSGQFGIGFAQFARFARLFCPIAAIGGTVGGAEGGAEGGRRRGGEGEKGLGGCGMLGTAWQGLAADVSTLVHTRLSTPTKHSPVVWEISDLGGGRDRDRDRRRTRQE